MQIVKAFTFIFVCSLLFMAAKPAKKQTVNWLTPARLQESFAKEPRPILIDMYTHWCGWCKVMDKETYAKDEVANYINTHYYALKFDAESKEDVIWAGKKYAYNTTYKTNELAIYLMGGQMSYPTTVFLTKLDGQPAPLPGYLKPNEIEAPLKYFGDGAYKTKSFQQFNQAFKASW
jgi:thioredoxin-related protein